MSAITWTTPTYPILIKGGNVLGNNCKIYITLSQGRKSLTYEATDAESTETGVLVHITLGQIESGCFCAGAIQFQVNVIDSSGFRAASLFETDDFGSNSLKGVITYG